MAKLDYEKLLGGYATGALTEAECQALFEAALHDQALFDALADEQALKELLDDPENRRRLIATLEAFEGTQEKQSRWGALVPDWAMSQSARASRDSIYASAPDQARPKGRSWRGVLAGSLILGALAVIVAAGLIEEMMAPPQPVLTADARHSDEGASSAPSPAPPAMPAPSAIPTEPTPPVVPPATETPPPSEEKLNAPEQSSKPDQEREPQTVMRAHAREDREARARASEFQRRRSAQAVQPSPPAASPSAAATRDERVQSELEREIESLAAPSSAGSAKIAVESQPPSVSARALFYAGAVSIETGQEGTTRDPSLEELKDESRLFAKAPKDVRLEAGEPASTPAQLKAMMRSPGRLLGVRYSLVKKTAGGKSQEVSPATVFNADEATQLSVEVNMAGYLYVLKMTPPEVWTVLYPSLGTMSDPAGRAAYVHSGTRYVIPSTGSLTGTTDSGPVQLMIIFTRDPQPELGSLGTGLAERDPAQSRRISDLIRRIRTEVAGGKVLSERAEPGPAERQAEQAVYVVDRGPVPMSRLLADITLSTR